MEYSNNIVIYKWLILSEITSLHDLIFLGLLLMVKIYNYICTVF
jgi:hypothetical protein